MRRGSRTRSEVVEQIRALWQKDKTAAAITRTLEEELADPPTERTVRGIVKKLRDDATAEKAAGSWDFMDPAMPPEDARLVMDLISAMPSSVRDTGWRPSVEAARRFVRIRRAYPETDPLMAWLDTVGRPDDAMDKLIEFSEQLRERNME
jgi:hypothetical protein